ncbi:1-deoxy-D-xylulose-5-phosphate reductoisomerase [Devriesea agamarum]|uniref:1-deoxy-D-xylulose-5-phosphate reductoisomerase n=1 Tax=Devriesea agamarum TaxID=472569 RepID=UPI000A061323|nr:1-deoxy-D-xylulose-5-phosphate reductoisomerase [Devriesea agamarum]
MRSLVVLGSTGSIGTQTLDVISRYPGLARVRGLAASGSRPELLAQQAAQFAVERVAISSEQAADAVHEALVRHSRDLGVRPARVEVGLDAVENLAGSLTGTADGHGDVVLNAMTGSVGLRPTLAALASGARLALANKESLISGGALVTAAAGDGQLLPVDSEHTAIAQCVAGVPRDSIGRLVITASGGPFRGRTREELTEVTPAEALAHPTWAMGRTITTNSATLINKALEVIEACWLFGMPEDRVSVVVHPQSIVHSMVELVDGATIALASPPDMRHAIGWALGYPDHLPGLARPCDWTQAATWTFEPLDEGTFRAVALARQAHRQAGVRMAVLNAVNEEAVDAFHNVQLSFLGICDLVEAVLMRPDIPEPAQPLTVNTVLAAEEWARATARTAIATAVATGSDPVALARTLHMSTGYGLDQIQGRRS